MEPETRYLKVGDVHLAYQTLGEGPVDLVHVPGIFSHLEYQWEEPSYARYLRHLASFCRLILFDPRGLGLSDRAEELPILEQQMDDLGAVLDAVGSQRAVIFGSSQGGPMALLFAATYPARTTGLVLYGTYATARVQSDYPWGRSPEWIAEYLRMMESEWGKGSLLPFVAPSRAGDEAYRRWWARLERIAGSPGNALAYMRMVIETDVRNVLPTIAVPTLVLQRHGDIYRDPRQARYLAERIPGARLVDLPGIDHLPFAGDSDAIVREVESFARGLTPEAEPERELATVLFVDIADSTERAAEVGDRRWAEVLEGFLTLVRRELVRHRGREIDAVGDGVLARFDGPARAVRCAFAVRDGARQMGLTIRAGLHTGELEVRGGKVRGIAVHIGSRVAGVAERDEVVVSSTVRDLVAGSGLRFADRGTHPLKGVPGEWRLFAAAEA